MKWLMANCRIAKTESYNSFLEDFQDHKKWLKNAMFMKWVRCYADFYGYEFKEGKHGIIGRWFALLKSGEQLEKSDLDESLF